MTWLTLTWRDEGAGVAARPIQGDLPAGVPDHATLQQLFAQPSMADALPAERQPVVTVAWEAARNRWCFAARGIGGARYGSAGTFHYAMAPQGMRLAEAWRIYFGAGGDAGFPMAEELDRQTAPPIGHPATDPLVRELLELAFLRPTLGEVPAGPQQFISAVGWVAQILPEASVRTYSWTNLQLQPYREKRSTLALAWPPAYEQAWTAGRARLGPVTQPGSQSSDPEVSRALTWLITSAQAGRFPAAELSVDTPQSLADQLRVKRPLDTTELETLWVSASWAKEGRFEPGLRALAPSDLAGLIVNNPGGWIERFLRLSDPETRTDVLVALWGNSYTSEQVVKALAGEAGKASGPLTRALVSAGADGRVPVKEIAVRVVTTAAKSVRPARLNHWLVDAGLDPKDFTRRLPVDPARLIEDVKSGRFEYLRDQLDDPKDLKRRDAVVSALVEGLARSPEALGATAVELAKTANPDHVVERLILGCPGNPRKWIGELAEGMANRASTVDLDQGRAYAMGQAVVRATFRHDFDLNARAARAVARLAYVGLHHERQARLIIGPSGWRAWLRHHRTFLIRWLLVIAGAAIAVWLVVAALAVLPSLVGGP